MTNSPTNINAQLARDFKDRAEVLGYKGKRRDAAMLDFWIGAWSALVAVGLAEEAKRVGMTAAFILAPRGYGELHRYIENAGEGQQA